MLLIPLIYLKNSKAQKPVETNPAWFKEDPTELAKFFISQRATHLYLNDLNIPPTGRSENLATIQSLKNATKMKLWVAGNFRSTTAIEAYVDIGVEKIVVGTLAYQTPDLFKEICQKFPQKIAATIEVRNKHVVIPGMVSPAHKSALDYAGRFEEEGVACFCYSEGDAQGQIDEESFKNIRAFCNHAQVPVLNVNDVRSTDDLEKLFSCESSGLMGVVVGKSLYDNRIDLHGAVAFMDELAARVLREPTLSEQ